MRKKMKQIIIFCWGGGGGYGEIQFLKRLTKETYNILQQNCFILYTRIENLKTEDILHH